MCVFLSSRETWIDAKIAEEHGIEKSTLIVNTNGFIDIALHMCITWEAWPLILGLIVISESDTEIWDS